MTARNPSLDVLRGLAIALVLALHFPIFPWIARYGGSGVTLFFVLSGFLISGLLFAEYERSGSIRWGRFVLRRGLKIWPSLYVYLFFCAFLLRYFPDPKPWHGMVLSAVFLSNYCSSGCAGIVGHTWSLAVEEHFYLILPALLLLLIWRKKLNWIPALCIFSMLSCAYLRYLNPEGAHYRTQDRFDSLFIGVTLAYLSRFRPVWFAKIGRTRNLLLAVPCILAWDVSPALSLALVHIGFAIILAWMVQHEFRGSIELALRPLSQLGVYSYCIYLWQEPFAVIVRDKIMRDKQISIALLLELALGAIVLGVAMSRLVERPILAVRDRWLPSRAGGTDRLGQRGPSLTMERMIQAPTNAPSTIAARETIALR